MRTDRPIARAITERFFEALGDLISRKETNMSKFCKEGNFSRPKYQILKTRIEKTTKEESHNYLYVDIDALSFICDKYGVSAEWLLLGRGRMFA